MRKVKRILSLFLAIALTLTMFSAISAPTVEAKTKVKTKTIKVTMYVGEKCQLGYSNLGEGVLVSKAKTSKKSVVKVSNKKVPCSTEAGTKAYRTTLTAKKAGKANITYTMKLYDKKSRTCTYKVKAKITVKKKVPALTYSKDYKVTTAIADGEDEEHCYFNFKLKQTKEAETFFKSHILYGDIDYDINLKVDGKTVYPDVEWNWDECGIRFPYLENEAFTYYDVYRVTDDTKMNWYGREGCVLTKIDTVFEMNKEGEDLFVNDKLTNQDSDDVMMFNEKGESVDREFDGDGEPLYDNLWSEAKARNLIVSTTCGVYEYADGHTEYYKAGDIIKVRSWKVPTGKEVASYIQTHPDRFEITIKPVSVKCAMYPNFYKYFPIYCYFKGGDWVFNWNTLKF